MNACDADELEPRALYEELYCARGDMENRIKEQQLHLFATRTSLATAYCSTLRLKLLKIGARVRVTTRKVWVSLSSSYPHQGLFAQAYDQLQRAGPAAADKAFSVPSVVDSCSY